MFPPNDYTGYEGDAVSDSAYRQQKCATGNILNVANGFVFD